MSLLHAVGGLAFVIVGITLGLFGSGGSVLTVPILIYLFGFTPFEATGGSLFIVGVMSLIGAIQKYKEKAVEVSATILFAIPSMAATFAMRAWLMPRVPNRLFGSLGKQEFLMYCFIALILVVAIAPSRKLQSSEPPKNNSILLAVIGACVGLIAGALGAGGGFLIVPALISFSNFPVSKAVGTSLAIISIQSLAGFSGEIFSSSNLNWATLLICTLFAFGGMALGLNFSKKIETKGFQSYFKWFLLIVALVLLGLQLLNR